MLNGAIGCWIDDVTDPPSIETHRRTDTGLERADPNTLATVTGYHTARAADGDLPNDSSEHSDEGRDCAHRRETKCTQWSSAGK